MSPRGLFVTVVLTAGLASTVGFLAYTSSNDAPSPKAINSLGQTTETKTFTISPEPSADPETYFLSMANNWETSWLSSTVDVRDAYCKLWETDAQSVVDSAAVPNDLPMNIPASTYLRSFANFISSKCGEPNSFSKGAGDEVS